MRVAIISDVHGNLAALEAVIADIATRDVSRIVNLGDNASGPLWPRETVELLMRQSWIQICGNHDRQVAHGDPASQGVSDRFAFSALSSAQIEWLRALPATATLGDVLLCHGTPTDDRTYLLETVADGRLRLASPGEIARRLGNVSSQVVACGHSHVPRVVTSDTGVMLVNPGSVGLQAFSDTHPSPHVSETGSPHARYAILESRESAWVATAVTVPYDHRAAAARASENGQPRWSAALATGYVQGR